MVILIEGPTNTGKSYLIKHSKFDSYKFPFIPYYKSMVALKPEDTGANSKEAFHFTTAFDVTLFSMMNAGIMGPVMPLLIDRSFMSNIVLGEIQSRITHEEGIKYLDYLAEQGYLADAHMIYVDKMDKNSGRSGKKDDWDFLGYEEQKLKYEQYFKYLKDTYSWEPTRFVNSMVKEDIAEFDKTVILLHVNKSKSILKKGLGSMNIFNKEFLDSILD